MDLHQTGKIWLQLEVDVQTQFWLFEFSQIKSAEP
jgi:hypothetical protein